MKATTQTVPLPITPMVPQTAMTGNPHKNHMKRDKKKTTLITIPHPTTSSLCRIQAYKKTARKPKRALATTMGAEKEKTTRTAPTEAMRLLVVMPQYPIRAAPANQPTTPPHKKAQV